MDKLKNSYRSLAVIGCLFCIIVCASCNAKLEDKYIWKSIEVTATAYNSVTWQTQGNPVIAAWGDSLKSDIPSIAVSRNLIALGLKHNTPIKIEGFDGVFLVKDKMHRRWRNRIDIYMGKDVQKAKTWGRQQLTIRYGIPKDTVELEKEDK
jgi:3D (Asp-Asp-Asp) domain-containing protein